MLPYTRTLVVSCLLALPAWQRVHPQTRTDSTEAYRKGALTILPVIGSAPETGFQFGATVLRIYRLGPSPSTRTSQQQIYAVYTAKSQARAFVQVDRWTSENIWRMRLRGEYQRFPLPYYGIGDSTPDDAEEWYTSTGPIFEALVQRLVLPRTYLGAGAKVTHVRITNTEDGKGLAMGTVVGAGGGTVAQAQAVISRDSRDNVISAHSGNVAQLTANWSNHLWGSDFDFSRYVVDLQRYQSFGRAEHVVAAQVRFQGTSGTAPFDQLVQYGSDNDLRGYTRGRYRDNHGASAQVEYRSPYVRRVGVVGFVGAGTVASAIADLPKGALLPTYGGGLRFLMNAEQRSAIRIDFGLGKGSSGLYVSLGQAF